MDIVAHGVDLVDIARIEAMLVEHGERFTTRCFTEDEQTYADSAQRTRAERYAARFACTEAVLKALGTGWREGISWRHIEVRRTPSGQPQVILSGRCAELADEMGIGGWYVSLSHSRGSAMASVIATGRG